MKLFVNSDARSAPRKRTSLGRSIDLSALVSIMLALVFLMIIGAMYPIPSNHAPVDVAPTTHSVLQPGARRDDAIEVAITRDGAIYFQNTRIRVVDLPNVLREAASKGAEQTVYIKADAHTKYGDVKALLDEIRQSGLQNITFLTEHP